MTAANIKISLIEKVKSLNNIEAKRVYGLMLEYDVNDSMFNVFDEVPGEHKLMLVKGTNDLLMGRKQIADEYIEEIKKKYAQ